MTTQSPNALARALRTFFVDYLPRQRGLSPHTIHSYRDTLVLLLRFLAVSKGSEPARLDLDDILPEDVVNFLTDLESTRHNKIFTRNVRLAAIHAFFHHVAALFLEHLEQAQRILSIPSKRAVSQPVDYLEAALRWYDSGHHAGCGRPSIRSGKRHGGAQPLARTSHQPGEISSGQWTDGKDIGVANKGSVL